jgi:type I restriction enzyme S subunit
MKSGWEIKKLGDVCEFINGRAYKKDELLDNGKYPVLRVGNFFTNDKWYFSDLKLPENKYCDKGDLLYAWSASFGPRIWQGEKVIYHYHIWKIIENSKLITRKFLYFLLDWDTDNLKEKYGTGTTMTHVGKGSIESREVPIPPLSEQRRIVAILDEAFAGIAAAKEKAEQNLKNAKEVFTHYLKQVFNTKKNGWVENNIGEICLLKSGTTMPHDLEKETGDIPYLKVADMNFEENIGCITMSSRFLDKKDIKDSIIIPKGAVIFPKRGGAILTNKKRMTSIPICADLNIMAVIPTCEIESKLLYYYFLDVDMKKIGTGSSIPQINNYDISPLSIVYPRDLSKQKEIVSFLDEISEETGTLESIYQQKLANLEELKKSLLQQAFSGAL